MQEAVDLARGLGAGSPGLLRSPMRPSRSPAARSKWCHPVWMRSFLDAAIPGLVREVFEAGPRAGIGFGQRG